MKDAILRMAHPAYGWENATPVGCGSLGAMLYGTISEERISLNEEHIWNGGEQPLVSEGFREKLDEARSLLLRREYEQADRFMRTSFSSYFKGVASYEAAGEVFVSLHSGESTRQYARELNLTEGVARVTCLTFTGDCSRELFASYPRKLIAMRFGAEGDFRVRYERECLRCLTAEHGEIRATGTTQNGEHPFCVTIRLKTDGRVREENGMLFAEGASWGELYIAIASSFDNENPEAVCRKRLEAAELGYDALKAESAADVRALMERSEIDFGEDTFENLPVPERLARLKYDQNAIDPGLFSLYFQFGKYLLVASSRPGTLPANLQGVWSSGQLAAWGSDYHTNINLQMNYWHAEVANLPECCDALFSYMNDYLLEPGKRVAQELYHARGTVLHHLSDIYGFASPADGVWGMWSIGAAWLCYHMWEHYLYSGDEAFLENVAYPYVRESVLFFLDTLFEDAQGRLMTGPSASPENRYYANAGSDYECYICISPTMDVEVVGGLLRFYGEIEKRLGKDEDTARRASEALAKLPPLQVGKHGQLMEWLEDFEEAEPGHRHISHAFALYPDSAISRGTPELMNAIRTTLERRLARGGGHTGWSRAWLTLLFARLFDADSACESMRKLLTNSTLDNLFDNHPPFQIDGNFGGAAGLAEIVMQSHEGHVVLLPALSKQYPSGSFRGLRARGGYEVSAAWREGRVTEFTVKSARAGQIEVELPASQGRRRIRVALQPGENRVSVDGQ